MSVGLLHRFETPSSVPRLLTKRPDVGSGEARRQPDKSYHQHAYLPLRSSRSVDLSQILTIAACIACFEEVRTSESQRWGQLGDPNCAAGYSSGCRAASVWAQHACLFLQPVECLSQDRFHSSDTRRFAQGFVDLHGGCQRRPPCRLCAHGCQARTWSARRTSL